MPATSQGRQRCVPRYCEVPEATCAPVRKNSLSFPGLSSFDKVLETLGLAKMELGEILSSFELMDKLALDVSTSLLDMKSPLASNGHEFYVLMETSGSNVNHDGEKLASFIEKALADDIIEDGTLTSDPAKVKVGSVQ